VIRGVKKISVWHVLERQGHSPLGKEGRDKELGRRTIVTYIPKIHWHEYSQMSNILLHGFLGSGRWRQYRIAVLESDANRENTYAPPSTRPAEDTFEWEQ
jgi:hypothetical protein